MSSAPAAADPSGDALLHQHEPLAAGFPAGAQGRVLFAIALAFSTFQIVTAAHLLDLPSQIVRAVHVGFLLTLAFPLLAAARGGQRHWQVLAWTASHVS